MARIYRDESTFAVDGAKLSNARIEAGLAMSEVALELDCSKSQISRWEQGVLCPSESRIKKMIKLYGTADFVVAGQGFMQRVDEFLPEEGQ